MSRERILARRAQFVAFALAACGGSKGRQTVMVVGTAVPTASASAAPEPVEPDAGDLPDSDDDGIADRLDYCPKQPASAYGRGCPCLSIIESRIEIREKVQFGSNQSALVPSAMPILDNVASIIKSNPTMHVRIEGHGDDQELALTSAVRAKVVFDYLVLKGVDPSSSTSRRGILSRALGTLATAFAARRRRDLWRHSGLMPRIMFATLRPIETTFDLTSTSVVRIVSPFCAIQPAQLGAHDRRP